ncbi:MAG TPA: hypothetical protein VHO24_19980 [Opitutaceae bacterium]|nr:hypothetical protein [Opitutaceae bacterium]
MRLRFTVMLAATALAVATLRFVPTTRPTGVASPSHERTAPTPSLQATVAPPVTSGNVSAIEAQERSEAVEPERGASTADQDPGSVALEELARRDPFAALASALAEADETVRRTLLVSVLRGWARADVVGAGTWILSQSYLEHKVALAALFNGAMNRPDDAIRFAREAVRANSTEANACSEALISALCNAGKFEPAALFAANDARQIAAGLASTIYRRWGEQAPRPAWESALTLNEPGVRVAALESATHAWSLVDSKSLADAGRQLAAGPDRTLVLTMAIRAWLDQDLDAASAWVLRWVPTGTLEGVDLDLVLEE